MHLVLQWPTLGPYHVARIRGVVERARTSGIFTDISAAETTSKTAYLFDAAAAPVSTTTLFSGAERGSFRAAWTATTRVLDDLQPDAVAIISYALPEAQAALAWCRRHRRIAIMMNATKADDRPRRFVTEWPKRVLISAFDAALVGGDPQQRYFESLGMPSERIALGYNVVDNAWWGAQADAARAAPGTWAHLPGLDSPRPFFLTVARFMPRKNLDGLIRAYAAYRANPADTEPWPLVIVGAGAEEGALRRLAEEQQRQHGGITFAGAQPAEAVAAYYALAGAYVHPAHADQWGLSVNEAMAARAPVIVSTGAGCAENLVVEGTGFRFDPSDEAALAALLHRVSVLPEAERTALGEAARLHVAAWGPSRFAEGMEAAVRAGRARADRPFPLAARALLTAFRTAAPLYDRLLSDDR